MCVLQRIMSSGFLFDIFKLSFLQGHDLISTPNSGGDFYCDCGNATLPDPCRIMGEVRPSIPEIEQVDDLPVATCKIHRFYYSTHALTRPN